jgi:copper resistance protein D
VYQLSVLLHILAATVWIGGMLFLALVIVPVTRGLPPRERSALFHRVGVRFRTVGWACIAVLVVTGAVNMAYRGVTWENVFTAELWASDFGRVLALKLALVVAMLLLSVYHDFVLGPASTRAHAAGDGRPAPEADVLRRRASLLGRANAALALLVVALATLLVRGVPRGF